MEREIFREIYVHRSALREPVSQLGDLHINLGIYSSPELANFPYPSNIQHSCPNQKLITDTMFQPSPLQLAVLRATTTPRRHRQQNPLLKAFSPSSSMNLGLLSSIFFLFLFDPLVTHSGVMSLRTGCTHERKENAKGSQLWQRFLSRGVFFLNSGNGLFLSLIMGLPALMGCSIGVYLSICLTNQLPGTRRPSRPLTSFFRRGRGD